MYSNAPRTSISGPSPRSSVGATPRSVSDDGDTFRKGAPLGAQLDGHLRQIAVIECGEATVMCTQYNRGGSLLAVGLADGLIKIYDPDTLTLLFTLSDPETQTKHLAVTSLRFLPARAENANARNLLLATYASGLVKIWHFSSQSSLFTENEKRGTLCSTFNPDGTKFVTAGSDSVIQIYDVETRKRLRACEASDARDKMNGHRWRIFAVKYHDAQPRQFITGGWDDTVHFWDDRDKHSIRKFSSPHICGDSLDIDPLSNHILTGSWRKEKAIEIWDYSSGEKVAEVPLDPINSFLVYSAQWLSKDYLVCGGCDKNVVKVIDRGTLNTIGQLSNLEHGVYCVDNTKVGNNPKCAVGSASSVYIIQVSRM